MATDGMARLAEFRARLCKQLGSDRFSLWFDEHARFLPQGNRLVVAVNHPFLREWMAAQFRDVLHQCWQQVAGQEATVSLEVHAQNPAGTQPETPSALPRTKTNGKPVNGHAVLEAGSAKARQRVPAAANGREVLHPARRLSVVFCAGRCNALAYQAARKAVIHPGLVSPVLVYGPPGTGKSHLLRWVQQEYCRRHRGRALLLSGEQFTAEFVQAVRGGGMPSFRNKYRHLQLLLVDNVQFLAGKTKTVQELGHTLDHLLKSRAQVILTADRPPQRLELGAELQRHLQSGVCCAMRKPGPDVRRQILQHLADEAGLELDAETVHWAAQHLDGSARVLVGFVQRLKLAAEAWDRPLDQDLVQQLLEEQLQWHRTAVGLDDIEKAVCRAFGVDPQQLRSASRTRAASHPRMLAMYLARKHTRAALSEIGRHFHRRHSTVVSAQKTVSRWLEQGQKVQLGGKTVPIEAAIDQVEQQLRAG